MIYSDILTKTEQVRDRLVSAINSKGGSLVSNASLNQCADAITNLPEGGTGGGAEIPGQIFHASFAEDSEYAESGQPLVKIGTLVFGTVDGIPCVRLGEGGFQVDYPLFTGNKPFTISYWGKCVTENDPGALPLHQGVFQSFRAIFTAHNGGNFYVSNSDGLAENAAHVEVAEKFIFHHYLATYDQKKFRLFVDNEQLAESSYEFSLDIPRDPFYIGYNTESINTNQFYLANMRIFTRVLSADEISTLYDEFVNRDNPSGGGGGETPVPIPQNGLKFYAPLKTSFVAETGQTLNESLCANIDGVVFENVDGVPCAFYSTGSAATAFYNLIDNYASPLTVSYWGKANGEPDCHVSLRRQETTSLQNIPGTVLTTIDFDSLTVTEAEVAELANATTVNNDIVHHYCYTQDGSSVKIFKDGVILSSANHPLSYNDGRIYLEIVLNKGSIGSVRVYNRALSEDEVKILASEFSPVVGELFFTTTKADGKPDGGYMASGTGTLKLQLATGEITELSLTDTNQRAFSAYELSNVRVVSGAQGVTWLSINRIGIDYIDLSNFWSLERLHMPISSSPEIKNLSSCHRLKYVDVGNSALSSAQVDQILSDILASNSHLNSESFSGSIDVSQNAVPTAAGLETIEQLESVGWSVNYDRE